MLMILCGQSQRQRSMSLLFEKRCVVIARKECFCCGRLGSFSSLVLQFLVNLWISKPHSFSPFYRQEMKLFLNCL
uniref:Uncharacterized protein n=1 Tax=Brassica oleracea TaxID=3712 RepID=A0A3P6C4K7_BRAOL|nr:unnamed protein product [Brassica oleracea]